MSWLDSFKGTSRQSKMPRARIIARPKQQQALLLEKLEDRTLLSTYSILELTIPGGRRGYSYGMNDSATTVGDATPAGVRFTKATQWDSAGNRTELGVIGGNKFSVAEEINNLGRSAGSSNFSASPTAFHAFYYNGGFTDLGTLSGSGNSFGKSISTVAGTDTVVGYSNFTGGAADKYHAYQWTSGGFVDRHPTFGGDTSRAEGINSVGQIVGYGTSSTSGAHTVAFLYSGGGYTDLGLLPDPDWDLGVPQGSEAYAINNDAVIAGASYVQGGFGLKVYRGWIKTGGTFTELGDLGLGGKHARPLGINDSEVVVGEANTTFGDSLRHAFVWTAGDGIQDLNSLIPGGSGWVLQFAYDVNNSGQITGWGTLNGKPRGFLLTPDASPIPTPGRPVAAITARNLDVISDSAPLSVPLEIAPARAAQQPLTSSDTNSELSVTQTPSIRTIAATHVAADVVNANLQDPLT